MSETRTSSGSPLMNEAVSPKPSVSDETKETILARARERGAAQNLMCAGAITPEEAWALAEAGEAVIVDVRTLEEYKFVGRVANSTHVPWMCGLSMIRNPSFINEIEKTLPKDKTIILLCRSGQRSVGAAEAMTRAGYTAAYNLDEGFEGTLDENRQRGSTNGWRYRGLPWMQD
ncbi:rhodanese-like domain-containing protein [Oxalobacter vibrioformis]|uniref:Rhodanese-like domain-containing protein n=1 Tax=Oxalobacter vibrioformis TaxID=933080 RepID=A0A9E9LW15_9BURK|nr:rhodanese-like domain-containing protein [Oxalobacter vibrioformis]WAW10266.1 rhodanese-like domain-containing protein [Oxalobacter vibrioformis]